MEGSNTKANFKMVYQMVMESLLGQMAIIMRGTSEMERDTATAKELI